MVSVSRYFSSLDISCLIFLIILVQYGRSVSPICKKQIHTACVLGHQRAYRLSSGTPDARFEHYLQQMGGFLIKRKDF